jgi:hypothetical protein
MICRYCKTENLSGDTHCSGCGANLDARPNQVLSRRVYLVEEAQPSVKKAAKLIPFAMILAALLVVASACMCLFGSFFDIPFISGFKTEREMAQMRGAFEDAQEQADALDSLISSMEGSLSRTDMAVAETFADNYRSMVEAPSIWGIKTFTDFCTKNETDLVRIFRTEFYAITNSIGSNGFEDNSSLYDTILALTIVFGVFLLILTILGALSNNTGFALAAAFISILYGLLLANAILGILCAVALVAESLLIGKVNKAYKKYVSDNSI